MSYSRELASEFRNSQSTFVYYLCGVNLAIIGFLFTQINKFENCIEFYFLTLGFFSLLASVYFSGIYLTHGLRWYQVVVNMNVILDTYPKDKKEVKEAIVEHKIESNNLGDKMAKCFELTIIFLGIGIVLLSVWKIVSII